ncbi:MAG: hypothetical protein ALECFALPRED_004487 [Alectoria fallacina]|uniref:Uncharacterized protein n=1 Tax=Alectoria fallacina TaxID=1903189 RepID=A0A8H3ISF7_9LECA|nr:MAG: hypothetical protein ALECFALPRED_004487 [Alectoria fallacina]
MSPLDIRQKTRPSQLPDPSSSSTNAHTPLPSLGLNTNTTPSKCALIPPPPSPPPPTSPSTRANPPVGSGTDSGISISTYTEANCKGSGLGGEELFYNAQVAQQFRSYSLSDDLGSDDVVSIWADANWDATGSKAVDASLNGDISAACAQMAYDLEGTDTAKGCHTLPNVVGCLVIEVAQS